MSNKLQKIGLIWRFDQPKKTKKEQGNFYIVEKIVGRKDIKGKRYVTKQIAGQLDSCGNSIFSQEINCFIAIHSLRLRGYRVMKQVTL